MTYYHSYESFQKFLDYITGNSPVDIREAACASLRKSSERDNFTQTHSFEDALSLAQNGWPAGIKLAKAIQDKHEEFFNTLYPPSSNWERKKE